MNSLLVGYYILLEQRKQLQLAGYEFSDLTVLRIEKGTRYVPDYEVVALAEFFHVSCEYLLGVQGKK